MKNAHPYQDQFNEICRLARVKDKKGLREYLSSNQVAIVLKANMKTPLEQLAFEKNHEAVSFLADHFNVCLDDAVLGYAEAGDVEHVEDMLARGASIRSAVRGYARAGMDDNVNELFDRGAFVSDAWQGYAERGFVERVYDLLALREGYTRADALLGFASGDQAACVEDLIKCRLSEYYTARAIQGYARAGLEDRVEDLLKRFPTQANLDRAVKGYAQSGLVDNVENLLARGANVDDAVQGYAQAGLVGRVDQLIKDRGASINRAAYGYGLVYSVNNVEDLLQRGASIGEASNGFYYTGVYEDASRLLRLAAFTESDDVRAAFTVVIQSDDGVELDRFAILRKARLINALMKKDDVGFDRACASAELKINNDSTYSLSRMFSPSK